MPQLDILTYFSQFVYLLISFITIYYFVIVFIIPNTVTATKLRAKFNSTTRETAKSLEKQTLLGESLLDKSFNTTSLDLASKSTASFSVEDLKTQNKAGKQNIQSALMFYFPSLLANKKRLIFSELL